MTETNDEAVTVEVETAEVEEEVAVASSDDATTRRELIGRRFSTPGLNPYDAIEWERRSSAITSDSGDVLFEQRDVEVPAFWSQNATNIVVSKYFYGEQNTPARETSVKQLIDRVVDTIGRWGRDGGYFLDGEEVITSTIAIGTNQNPTPTGIFFVTDSVTLRNPDSLWGPYALGISARSDTITEFNGGDGIIGIHGTSNPSSIGRAVSLGCIRLPNDLITELHTMVPLGTPVEIRA